MANDRLAWLHSPPCTVCEATQQHSTVQLDSGAQRGATGHRGTWHAFSLSRLHNLTGSHHRTRWHPSPTVAFSSALPALRHLAQLFFLRRIAVPIHSCALSPPSPTSLLRSSKSSKYSSIFARRYWSLRLCPSCASIIFQSARRRSFYYLGSFRGSAFDPVGSGFRVVHDLAPPWNLEFVAVASPSHLLLFSTKSPIDLGCHRPYMPWRL